MSLYQHFVLKDDLQSEKRVTPACADKSWDMHEVNNCCFYLFETKGSKKQEFSWQVCCGGNIRYWGSKG